MSQSLIFGLDNGNVIVSYMSIISQVFGFEINDKAPNMLFVLNNEEYNKPICIIKSFDFSQRGKADQIIARTDGSIEIWGPSVESSYEIRGSLKQDEAVSGLDCGIFGDNKASQILVSTYGGKIIGLIDEANKNSKPKNIKPAMEKQINTQKIDSLRAEIAKLENDLELVKSEMGTENPMPAPVTNKVNWKMTQIKKTNNFKIQIDSQSPIKALSVECSKSIIVSQSLDTKVGILSDTSDEFSNEFNFYCFNFGDEQCSQFEFIITIIEVKNQINRIGKR